MIRNMTLASTAGPIASVISASVPVIDSGGAQRLELNGLRMGWQRPLLASSRETKWPAWGGD